MDRYHSKETNKITAEFFNCSENVDSRDGRGRVFSCGAGRGKGKNLRGGVGSGQGKGQNLRVGAGQNVSVSADLDHLLKKGNLDLNNIPLYFFPGLLKRQNLYY